MGFLSDERRLNVALSRARRLLVVLGDKMCLSETPGPFQRLHEISKRRGWDVDLASSEGRRRLETVSVHL